MKAALHALDAPTREADLLSWQVDYRRLAAEDYPNLAAALDDIPAVDSAENFPLLVELLISAIRARSAGT